jgi:hypothetical protein
MVEKSNGIFTRQLRCAALEDDVQVVRWITAPVAPVATGSASTNCALNHTWNRL